MIRISQHPQEINQGDDITVQVNSSLFTLKRNDRDIADFLWELKSELTSLNIPIPQDPLSLDNQQMQQLLSQIASNPKLFNTDKVRGFFENNKHHDESANQLNTQIFQTHRQMQTTVSIQNEEMVSYIQSLGYSQVQGIADGASKAVFKAKNQRKEYVAVKVSRLEQRYQQEQDIVKGVQQKMSRALFGGFLKVNRLIKDEGKQLMIIQEQLANKTLRDIILEKRQKSQNFTQSQLKKIIKDMVESLYHMHIQNQVAHRDIKPHNIFYMGHRYSFGDYGQAQKKMVNILNPNIKIKMTQLKGTPMYMEPRLLELWNKIHNQTNRYSVSLTHNFTTGGSFFQYDPFKADIYSLGLVFLELCLHNLGYNLDQQMQNILCYQRNQPTFNEWVRKSDLRSKDEKYILFDKLLFEMPSLLERMLQKDQALRIPTFNLALLATPKQTLLGHLLTPFTDIFVPNKTLEDQENSVYTVEYNYKGMVYRGQFKNQKREGYGTIYSRVQSLSRIRQLPTDESQQDSEYKSGLERSYDLVPIYEGEWKNDLPHGQGRLTLNDSDNSYQGSFMRGMFSGEGGLYYQRNPLFRCLWRGNYNQYILKPLKQFSHGRFRFRMVCPISKTVYGFQQMLQSAQQKILKKIFVIEIQIQHSAIIQSIIDEICMVHKKFDITNIRLKRNLIYQFSEYTLQNQNQSLVLIFGIDVNIESWTLNRIMETMNVEKMKLLHLHRSEIGSEPFKTISTKLRCFNITQLDLSDCYFISPEGLNRLFLTSIVNTITRMNLTSTQINNDTIRIFAESKYMVRLRQLILRGCLGITDYAIKHFIQSPNVKDIQHFDIGNTNLSQGFTQGFLWETQFKKLKKLKIDYLSFMPEDIKNLSEQPILQDLIQFHADPIWIRYIQHFSKLRSLTLNGHSKIPVGQLLSFVGKWNHTRLDITAIKVTKQQQNYQFYQQHLAVLRGSGNINSFTVGCCQIDIYETIQLMKSELNVLEVDMNKNIQIFKGEFENIKSKKWNIRELIFTYNNKHVLDYIIQILELDFSNIKIDSLKIMGHYSQSPNNVFEEIQDNKIRLLQFCEMLKKITTVIKVKTLKIQEIFYTDQEIANMVKVKISETTVETLIINGVKFSVNNQYMMNVDSVNFCANQTQTLDQALHALSVSECLSQLQALNLFKRQNVGQTGLRHIINSKYCENIKELDLSYTGISDNIFELLGGSEHLMLNRLTLNGIKSFNFQALKKYIDSKNAKKLKKMSLKDTNLNQLDVFFLQLTLDSLEEINIKFETSMDLVYVDPQKINIKYGKLKKIYLDFNNCELKSIIQNIFPILSSKELKRLKLNLRCCKQKDLKYYQVSQLIFLTYLKTRSFDEFRIYFDQTSIFETSFIVYLQTIRTQILDLSFQKVMNNQYLQKLSFIFQNFNIKNITLNISHSEIDDDCEIDIYNIIRGLKKVQELNINFSNCQKMTKWDKIMEAFSPLMEIKKLNLNFSDCNLGDEFEVMVHWIDQLTKKHKIQLTLDLANCQKIKLDRIFAKLSQLLSKYQTRFLSKLRLDVTRFNIPLDFKYKLIQLNISNRQVYELLVDSSDR